MPFKQKIKVGTDSLEMPNCFVDTCELLDEAGTAFEPTEFWGISDVGYGTYLWEVVNIPQGWKEIEKIMA